MKKIIKTLVASLMLAAIALSIAGCAVKPEGTAQAADIMDGIEPAQVSGKATDTAFVSSGMQLALELFRASTNESRGENVLISPVSIELALAMTANGADGDTLVEMEKLLGGNIPLDELNEYLYTYSNSLTSKVGDGFKLSIANSVWFRDEADRLHVEPDFLQKNADYYSAQVFKRPFDETTAREINSWIAEKTDGMIDKMIDEIDESVVLYLINALAFEAEWEKVYDKNFINDSEFTSISGEKQPVEMMWSEEGRYLDDGKATGFIKPYKGGTFSFAALLPNEGVDIYDYIGGMTADGLLDTLSNTVSATVNAGTPKFSFEYNILMNKVLSDLGMPTAFREETADFTRMGQSTRGNIHIGRVLHKTFIALDELGTKAGAVTVVEMVDESAAIDMKTVKLDRPFVFMIIDNETNLPLFIGALTEIN